MRTKTLLLTAALSSAGIATSMAQVYSVNAVGYVNTTIVPNGFSLISNPLDAADDTINGLFKTIPNIPQGLTVYKYEGAAGFAIASYDDLDLNFLPADVAAKTVLPGEGVFVFNPSATALTCTFVGEVPQGEPLRNPLPAGFSIESSQVPQEGTVAELGLPGAQGDILYQFDEARQAYDVAAFDDLAEPPQFIGAKPVAVGEAFFLFRGAAGSWDRTFKVSP